MGAVLRGAATAIWFCAMSLLAGPVRSDAVGPGKPEQDRPSVLMPVPDDGQAKEKTNNLEQLLRNYDERRTALGSCAAKPFSTMCGTGKVDTLSGDIRVCRQHPDWPQCQGW